MNNVNVIVDYPSFLSSQDIPPDVFRNATSGAAAVGPDTYSLVQRNVPPERRLRVVATSKDHCTYKREQRAPADEIIFFVPVPTQGSLTDEEIEQLRCERNVHSKAGKPLREVPFQWKRPSLLPSSPTSGAETTCASKPAVPSAASSRSAAQGPQRGSRGAPSSNASSLRTTCAH